MNELQITLSAAPGSPMSVPHCVVINGQRYELMTLAKPLMTSDEVMAKIPSSPIAEFQIMYCHRVQRELGFKFWTPGGTVGSGTFMQDYLNVFAPYVSGKGRVARLNLKTGWLQTFCNPVIAEGLSHV